MEQNTNTAENLIESMLETSKERIPKTLSIRKSFAEAIDLLAESRSKDKSEILNTLLEFSFSNPTVSSELAKLRKTKQ